MIETDVVKRLCRAMQDYSDTMEELASEKASDQCCVKNIDRLEQELPGVRDELCRAFHLATGHRLVMKDGALWTTEAAR